MAEVRSLEVRWIFPGHLEAAMAEWFDRFPAAAELQEDVYLLDPHLPGLSVKVRSARAFEVKAYRGSPGILDAAGRARGRMESWQKWSFPVAPPGKLSGDLAGRGAGVCRGTHRGPLEWCGLVDPGLRDDRACRLAAQPP